MYNVHIIPFTVDYTLLGSLSCLSSPASSCFERTHVTRQYIQNILHSKYCRYSTKYSNLWFLVLEPCFVLYYQFSVGSLFNPFSESLLKRYCSSILAARGRRRVIGWRQTRLILAGDRQGSYWLETENVPLGWRQKKAPIGRRQTWLQAKQYCHCNDI